MILYTKELTVSRNTFQNNIRSLVNWGNSLYTLFWNVESEMLYCWQACSTCLWVANDN